MEIIERVLTVFFSHNVRTESYIVSQMGGLEVLLFGHPLLLVGWDATAALDGDRIWNFEVQHVSQKKRQHDQDKTIVNSR